MYPVSMTESEREKFKSEVCDICGRLNSCSAVDKIVDVTVQIMRAVQQAEQYGHTVSVTRISLQTGEQETSRNPYRYEAEHFGTRMVAALPKEALEQCLAGEDYTEPLLPYVRFLSLDSSLACSPLIDRHL